MSIGCISELWQHMKNRRNRKPLHDRDVWVENQIWRERYSASTVDERSSLCWGSKLDLFAPVPNIVWRVARSQPDHRGWSPLIVLIWLIQKSNSPLTARFRKKKERKQRVFKYTFEPARSIAAARLPGSFNWRFCWCSGPRPIKVHTSLSGTKLYRIVKWLVG